MPLNSLRTWLRSRAPISPPKVLKLRTDTELAAGGHDRVVCDIRIPHVSMPGVSRDLAGMGSRTHPEDLAQIGAPSTVRLPQFVSLVTVVPQVSEDLAEMDRGEHTEDLAWIEPAPTLGFPGFVGLAIPLGALIAIDALDQLPIILDLFTGLVIPNRAGKTYGIPGEPGSGESPASATVDAGALDMTRCRHGLPRYMCLICSGQHKVRNRWQPSNRHISRRSTHRTVDVFDLLLPYLQPPIEDLLVTPVLFPPDRRPYDYQIRGIRFLAENKSALLGDEMGLGKTIEAIVALQALVRRGEVHRILVLCRRSLLGTWEYELKKWAPELFVLKVRGLRDEREWMWESPASVYLTTYDTARQDVARKGGSLLSRFDVVILDEVQDIKNPNTKRSRAVRQISASYRWGLSGTPVENKVDDVVAIFQYLKPGLFRPASVYRVFEVKRAIKPYFLRRRAADVLKDLPEKVSREVWLDLAPEQRKTYDTIFEQSRSALSVPGVTRIHALARLNDLRKICNLDPQSQRSCKLDYLVDQLDAVVENNQKALVFSTLPNVTLRKIAPQLQEYHPALFDGSLSDNQRESLIRRFQSDEAPHVLLTSVKAGGIGLTLTRANHVFHFDHWWNPAVTRQAEARAYRIGQSRTVFIHDIFTRDTIEERVHSILLQKQHLFDQVIDDLSAEYVRGAISDEELFALFDLKPPPPARAGRRR